MRLTWNDDEHEADADLAGFARLIGRQHDDLPARLAAMIRRWRDARSRRSRDVRQAPQRHERRARRLLRPLGAGQLLKVPE
jgi:hypothetical protein